MTHHEHDKQNSSNSSQNTQNIQNPQNDFDLDKTFEKMEKLGIPADIFGNINPGWRTVMKKYFDGEKQVDEKMQLQFQKEIDRIGNHCQTKYQKNEQKIEDCHQQAHLRIINQFQKPKELSEIMLSNFANKCLIRGNTIDFCTQEVLKQKKVINVECLKKLQGITEYL